ncbi:unnamed protein product [Hymenolepis diminuta]|uniref:Uncharacterized protein n=1 Tax=Hymenolepis diminuta TaxID=6216 RepID=A0A564YZF5_HYMDI|nr:unnamed protein product [Hymenolepis diminuta]
MESGTEKVYLRESSLRRGFKRLWLRISRCESVEDFLSLLFQLEHLLNSQSYSPKEIHRIIFPHFHLKSHCSTPVSHSRGKIPSQLMQHILYHAVLTNSPYDRLRCSELSHEIAQMISHRQISSFMSSSSLKSITSDLNLKTVLARYLTSRRALRLDNLINLLYYLKHFCNDGKLFYSLLQIYYRQRGLKSNSRKSSSLGDSRKILTNRIGSDMRREETALQQLRCIFDFADRLLKRILDDFHTSMKASVNSKLNNPCTPPRACKVNRRHYHTTASPTIEKVAERLEQSIMREALTSLRRLRHFQNRHQNYLSTPSSQQNSSTSKLLTQFADDIASQVMKEASESAEKRMNGIRMITDSILQSISEIESLDLKSALTNNSQRIFENETPSNVAEFDRRARLGNFAGNLTFQCLSEALQNLKKFQPN